MSLKGTKKGLQEGLLTSADDLERNNTFGTTNNDFGRKSTFSRALTFGDEVYNKTVSGISGPLEGLTRKLTQVGNMIDPDAKMTKAMLEDIEKIAETGPEGDMPLPHGFAEERIFWRLMFWNGIVAALMGLIGAAFMNVADEVPKHWATCDYKNDESCGEWYNGEKYFMLIPSGAGIVVGLIRWGFAFPDNLAGLFQEINDCHVHWEWSPLTVLISAISLGGGASLGPEAALGNLGGGMGTFFAHFIGKFEGEYENYNDLMVLSGMSAALGALFPTPILSTMMIHELGHPPRTYMESTMVMSVAACISFAVYYQMIGQTYLDYIKPTALSLSVEWETDEGGYHNWMWISAVGIGIVCAALCLVVLLFTGISKQIIGRIREKLSWSPLLKEVVPPFLVGISIGAINWALPGTVGNGSLTTDWVIKFGKDNIIEEKLLLCTGFARAYLLAMSMNSGFIGGMIFPFISMGAIAGIITYRHYPYLPLGYCLGTFMFAMPCGIVPLPFTFTCLGCFVFFFGSYETVPIFIAVLTSYLCLCGSGLLKKIGTPKKPEDAAAVAEAAAKAEEEKKQFKVEQYSNKRLANK